MPTPPLPFLAEFLHIHPQALIVLNVGRQPASGETTFTIRHGNTPGFRGELFTMQGLAGSSPQLTNPIAVSAR